MTTKQASPPKTTTDWPLAMQITHRSLKGGLRSFFKRNRKLTIRERAVALQEAECKDGKAFKVSVSYMTVESWRLIIEGEA